MKTRKFTALLLSIAMVLSSGIAAFAVDGSGTNVTVGSESATLGTGSDTFDTIIDSANDTLYGSVTIPSDGSQTVAITTNSTERASAAYYDNDTALGSAVSSALTLATPADDWSGSLAVADGGYILIGVDESTGTFGAEAPYYFVIAVTVDAGGTSPGGSASSDTIPGESTVQPIVYAVDAPTSLDFAIDPFGLGTVIADDSQITGDSYEFSNASVFPVKLEIDFETELAENVTIVSDPDTLAPDDNTVDDKDIYFAALGAKTITVAGNAITATVFDPTVQTGELAPFDTSGNGAIAFALKEGDGTVFADNKSTAAFTFYGVLNSYADWADNDLTISAEYAFSPLREDTYDTLSAASFGVNQVAVTTSEPVPTVAGFFGSSKGADVHTSAVIDVSKTGTDPLLINFFNDGKAVSMTTASGTPFGATEFAYSAETKKLEIKGTRLTNYRNLEVGLEIQAKVLLAGETTPYIVNMKITE
jgi:hypothetical protein